MIVGLAGTAAIGLCAIAMGGHATYEGKVRSHRCAHGPPHACALSFSARVHKGQVKGIQHLRFQSVPVHCRQGTSFLGSGGPLGPIEVHGNRFRRSFALGGTRFHVPGVRKFGVVRGRISSNLQKAHGRLKLSYQDGRLFCRGESNRWTARR
jgi:hypothetical protein